VGVNHCRVIRGDPVVLLDQVERGKIVKMKIDINFIRREFARLKTHVISDDLVTKIEQPLRAELFSINQLEQYGKTLAKRHEIDISRGKDNLLPRLAENEEILVKVYELLLTVIDNKTRITPAAEWLIDNFYVIEEQIRTAKQHFPKNYSRELPHLINGSLEGFPRVYDIALELISHSDGRVYKENLYSFISSYQKEKLLNLGELWAIPIMLRLSLIENLRRVAIRIYAARKDRNRANYWADRIIKVMEEDPKNLIIEMADLVKSDPNMSSAFVSELVQRLQGQSSYLALPITWIEQRLSYEGAKIEQLMNKESKRQASDQVSIGNSINSLRLLNAIDWKEFVEKMSVVNLILRNDPSKIYDKMDFETRDCYRHAIENISRNSRYSESEVAQKVVELAGNNAKTNSLDDKKSHVGYYLIDNGLDYLESITHKHFSIHKYLSKVFRRYPLLFYLGSIFTFTSLFTVIAFRHVYLNVINEWILVFSGVLMFICFSNLAVALINWLITVFVNPHVLPRMDYSKEIPENMRTLVVVPTIIYNKNNIEELLEKLEIEYLSNQGLHLHYGLLTDFADAPKEVMPDDEDLLNHATEGIQELNDKYKQDRDDIFYLFHRPRLWNSQEGVWMGYERKRGKLEELNSFLRGQGFKDKRTIIFGNNIDILMQVKYVITLDADTQISFASASKLIGTIAHPLNRAVYDEDRQCIREGYVILQPRLAVNMEDANKSLFVKIFSGEPGIDPYTKSVSDVYQDVFKEGSFIGKGIYDVDIFSKVLGDRFPKNLILSHDLLEGSYARTAIVSDINFYEKHPSSYLDDVARRHRWIRGDWQILSWVNPLVPGLNNSKVKNPISMISQWKILDNLRRSIIPISMLALLLLGWTVLFMPLLVTLSIASVVLIPSLLTITIDIIKKQKEIALKTHFNSILSSIIVRISQAIFVLVSLPYEAFYSLHAIILTLKKVYFTHKKMLEWIPSYFAKKQTNVYLPKVVKKMWFAVLISAAISVWFMYSNINAPFIVYVLLGMWFISPLIVWYLSRPLTYNKHMLSSKQLLFLRKLSRKTWYYFETFVTSENNWLPPDNYQEIPVERVAYRTSPTNIGLYLLSNLAALDFGYISTKQFLDRTKNTFNTMEKLEKHRNHFYNWYDTKTLRPLHPLYVSTVDSGNLMGHLMVLESGLSEIQDKKIFSLETFSGLNDTLNLLYEEVKKSKASQNQYSDRVDILFKELSNELECNAHMLKDIYSCIKRIEIMAGELNNISGRLNNEKVKHWSDIFYQQCSDIHNDIISIAPWLLLKMPNKDVWEKEVLPTVKGKDELWAILKTLYEEIPTLHEIAGISLKLSPVIENTIKLRIDIKWIKDFNDTVIKGSNNAGKRIIEIKQLALQCSEYSDMDFGFLYDESRHLLTIGYNVSQRRKDNSYYDLLASESRLCSYVSIAKKQIPVEHWFSLSRLLTTSKREPVLISWSGSMFEYLMPFLVMPTFENSLLDRTCKTVVNTQIQYGAQRGVPWGISESGYNITDAHLNYQYKAFGIPKLGFKSGLAEELVVAPYASVMALMVFPEKACSNLQRMVEEGYEGQYGFYEAIDYTASRIPDESTKMVVRSFMAHHQGMNFLSLSYVINNRKMQKRFENNLTLKSAELLLQERTPKTIPYYPISSVMHGSFKIESSKESLMRVFNTPNTSKPEIHLLSNGTYNVMITNSGAGYSRWKDLSVTRWREDTTRDNWGTFFYFRDLISGEVWSNTYQPTLKDPKKYESIFLQARAEFRRRDYNYETHTEISVSPEDDVELRRIRLTNRSWERKTVEITSYAEVVLLSPAADELHPVFSNLFVQTEIMRDQQAIICTRRTSSGKEKSMHMVHLMNIYGITAQKISYETDRLKFIGRGRSTHNPQVISGSAELSNTNGFVLDPIVSIRCVVSIEPEQTVTIDFISGASETREKAVKIIERYKDRHLTDRIFALAWTHGQVVLQQLNATESDAQLYGRLASSILYANSLWRANASTIIKNFRGQSSLWVYGISGDLPIVLLKIGNMLNIELVRQLIQAHAYWRRKGLHVDLMIINEDYSVYRQQLNDQIIGMIAASNEASMLDQPGGIFVRRLENISDEDKILLQAVSRIVITDDAGTLLEQIERRGQTETIIGTLKPIRTYEKPKNISQKEARKNLSFFNGIGGFTQDGREYVIMTGPDSKTPMPWVNVLANQNFGTVISESGSSYTWSENAHEFRLTPWNNDPINDISGEAIYIRDEETGRFWSPTPLPVNGPMQYVSRHGFGYSIFEYSDDGIDTELTVYVSVKETIKFSILKIRNSSNRLRKLSITNYNELVMGNARQKNSIHIITEVDPESGALFARNPYNTEFADRVVFLNVCGELERSVTGDRKEFLGRNGVLSNPAVMKRSKLSSKVGPGLDPCASMQVNIELAFGEEREIIFVFGSGKNIEESRNLIRKFNNSGSAHAELEAVWSYWKNILGTIYIETPDRSIDVLVNGWLLYQTIACRLFARSGYYQSGGAFGFRDQLQDVMAVIYASPDIVREHILRCAAHQFREGDVQHWWHSPIERGVRSHCSDDCLWLPLVVSRYVLTTGDTGVLDERINYIEGRQLKQEEESYYDKPTKSEESDILYEHCKRAIKYGLKYGQHGLPLIGSGDWNDGMNLVGEKGMGESVWLGFFLYYVLCQFSEISRMHNDKEFEELCSKEADFLKQNIEKNGWDGSWYLRAYTDNGESIGSAGNSECKIDSISQSWSVLSGAGDSDRTNKAMESLNDYLVDRNNSIMLLLKPPFDKSPVEPGYIKGYVPGIRENGGQYTHAAIWAIMAFAALRRRE